MASSGASRPDPFLLPDTFGISNLLEYRDTNGLTRRTPTINTSIRNLVLINHGQSQAISVLPTATVPANASAIDNFSVHDGACYNVTNKPLLGTQDYIQTPGGGGCIVTGVADLLVTNNKFDRVIMVPVAVSAASIADLATGVCATRTSVAMARLASRGIVPGLTNLTFAFLWMQGETDNLLATSSASYQASWAIIRANLLAAGFVGRMFVCKESYNLSVTSATVQAAQAAVVDNVVVFAGGDLDSINNASRVSGTHFNDAGGAAAATLIYNAMHASGAPF